MISQFHLAGPRPQISNADGIHRLLVLGNWGMLLGAVFTLLSVWLSYGLSQWLPLSLQIVAHISTLIFATAIKFGYILRCFALNRFAGFNQEQPL